MIDRKPEIQKKSIAAVIGLVALAVILCALGAAFLLSREGAKAGGQKPSAGDQAGVREETAEPVERLTLGSSEAFEGYNVTSCTAREGGRSVSGSLFVPSDFDSSEASHVMILCPGVNATEETLHGQAADFARAGLSCMTVGLNRSGETSELDRLQSIGILIRGLLSRPGAEDDRIILAGRDTGALTAGFAAAIYRDAVDFVVLTELPLRLLEGTAEADLPEGLEIPADYPAECFVTGDDERYTPLALLRAFRGPGLGISGAEDALGSFEDEEAAKSLLPGLSWARLKSGSYPAGAEAESEDVCAETASLVLDALRAEGLVHTVDAQDSNASQGAAAAADGQEPGNGEEGEAETASGTGAESADNTAGSGGESDGETTSEPSALLPSSDAQTAGRRIKTVACIGDSLTTGYRLEDPDGQCYPAQLQKLLGKDYQVINYGKGGYSLSGPEPIYTEHANYRKSQKLAADYYVILLGTNDAKPSTWNADAFEFALRDMIGAYRSANPEAVIILMTPSRIFRAEPEDGDGLSDDLLKNEIIPIIESVAPETNSLLIDLYSETAERRDLFQPDELHPTEEGTRLIARLVADVILG